MILLLSSNPPKVKLHITDGKLSIKKISRVAASLYNTIYYKATLDEIDALEESVKISIYKEIQNIILNEPIKIKKSRD